MLGFASLAKPSDVVDPLASRSFNDGGHSYTSVADTLRG